jgi:hypothetical protein
VLKGGVGAVLGGGVLTGVLRGGVEGGVEGWGVRLFFCGVLIICYLVLCTLHPLWQEDYCCVPNVTTSVRSEHHTGR